MHSFPPSVVFLRSWRRPSALRHLFCLSSILLVTAGAVGCSKEQTAIKAAGKSASAPETAATFDIRGEIVGIVVEK